ALGANVFVNYVAFGKISLTARTPPFLLARSIADGPGRLYLEKACSRPEKKYYLCDRLDQLSDDVNDFLWKPDGAYMSANPEQRAVIRSEQIEIVRNAAFAHPWLQMKSTLKNIWTNIFTINLSTVRTDLRWHHDNRYYAVEAKEPNALVITKYISVYFIYLSAVVALAVLLFLVFNVGWSSMFGALSFILFALITNAVVTGMLVGNSSRYQSRVIWVLPLAAIGN